MWDLLIIPPKILFRSDKVEVVRSNSLIQTIWNETLSKNKIINDAR